jgi:hypothetical protein
MGLPTNNASVDVNANGDGVAVWIDESNSKVMYALQKVGKWTTAKTLYAPSLAKNETTESVRVAIQADGTAMAIFSSTTPGTLQYCVSGGRVVRCYGPNKSIAKVATLSPGSTAWTKLNLSVPGISVKDTQVRLDQYGNATVFWSYLEKAGAPLALQVATKSPTLAWSAPVTVYSTSNPVTAPNLSLGASSQAILVWQEKFSVAANTSFKIRAVYSENSLTGTWSADEDVSTLLYPTWSLRSAMDGAGNAAVVWDENYSIEWARRSCTASCSWNKQTIFSAPIDYSMMASYPDIGVNAQGDFLIAWSKVSGMGNTIEAELHPLNGTVMSAWWYGNSDPKVSMSVDGSIGIVGWVDDNDYSAHAASFTSVQNQPSIWTQQAEVLLGPALWGSQIALCTAASGRASVIWLNNTNREFVYQYMGASLR